MCAHAGPRAPSQKTDLTLRVISTALNRVDSAEAPEQGGNVAVQADTHTAEGPRTSAECGRPIRAPLPHPTHGGRGSGEPDRWVCEESQISGSVRYSCYQGSDHWPQPGPCCSHPVTHQGLVRTPCHPPHLATPPLSGRPGIWACHEVQPISQQSKAWDPARTLTHTHTSAKKRGQNWTEALSHASPLITHGFVPAAVATASARATANTLQLACATGGKHSQHGNSARQLAAACTAVIGG